MQTTPPGELYNEDWILLNNMMHLIENKPNFANIALQHSKAHCDHLGLVHSNPVKQMFYNALIVRII